MFRRIITVSPLLIALASPVLPANVELAIGHPDIDPGFIEPYSARFVLERIDLDGIASPHGYWTDAVSFVEQGNRRVLRREVARFNAEGKSDLWRVHLVDAETLAPLVTDNRDGPGRQRIMHLDFDAGKVNVAVIPEPEKAAVTASFDVDPPAFDLSIWATLLMSVPFEAGYVAKLPVLGPGGVVAWELITVEGQELIELPDGSKIPTWKVSTRDRPWSAWLTKVQKPYIIKTVQNWPDGSRWVSHYVSD